MESFFQDVRYGSRLFCRSPGFTGVALAALTLGIGANTAIFSVLHAVVLRPLPYPEPERIVRIWETRPDLTREPRAAGFSIDHFREWREANTTLAQMAAYQNQQFTLTGVEEPVLLSGMSVSPDLFALLRVGPLLGRTLVQEDEQPGNEQVIVLSHAAWRKYLGSDPEVVGRPLTLDGSSYLVVGVMPAGFEFPDRETEFWVPLLLGPRPPARGNIRTVRLVPVIARLKDGVDLERAEAEGNALVERLREGDSDSAASGSEIHLLPLLEQMVAPIRPAILVLAAAVGLVLLIACANVANLLLARASERQREMALRAALGADPNRLLRQSLTESGLLAVVAGAAGVGLAYGGMRILTALAGESLPRVGDVGLNPSVLAFTALASLGAGVLFGLVPARESLRADLGEAFKEGSDTGAGGRSRLFPYGRVKSVLVVFEVALAVVLLVGAGLLVGSFIRLTRVDPGYQPHQVLTMSLNLPSYRYPSTTSRRVFLDQLLERLEETEGVHAAGVTNLLPLTQANVVLSFSIAGRPEPAREEEIPRANFRLVSPGYFRAMGIDLLRGREFQRADGTGAPPVVVVNEALVRQYFSDGSAVGERLHFGEIVGVVADVKHEGLDAEARPEFYLSYAQAPGMMGQFLSRMSLAVRTGGDSLGLLPSLRGQIARVDPDLPAFEAVTMEERVAVSVARPKLYAVLLGLFAGLALVLAISGVYGVIAYAVSRRVQETGVRMALGAQAGQIVQLIVRQGLTLVLPGIVLGVGAALGLGRLLSGLLYGVSPTEPTVLVGAATVLLVVALLACYVPARRASGLDPASALRYE